MIMKTAINPNQQAEDARRCVADPMKQQWETERTTIADGKRIALGNSIIISNYNVITYSLPNREISSTL